MLKKIGIFFLLVCISSICTSCKPPEASIPVPLDVTHKISLGETPSYVYVIATNTSTDTQYKNPAVTLLSGQSRSMSAADNTNTFNSFDEFIPPYTDENSFTDYIHEFNRTAVIKYGQQESTNRQYSQVPAQTEKVDDTKKFFVTEEPKDTISATCRKVITADGKTLYIYVADNCWDSSGALAQITQSDIDTLANKFLIPEANNDIYNWVSTIFGSEWGPHNFNNLIPESNSITIFLYDIADENTAGFFWSKDVIKNDETTKNSNERNMFYLDAPLYKEKPLYQISTLAHELQHMIQFYQKAVKQNTAGLDTWINEMCSLVTEDLIADKAGTDSPRGVNTAKAAPEGTEKGWLPLYNYSNYYPLTIWDQNDGGISYAKSYAFGAYIARNFGGAALFRKIVQNEYTDYNAVVEAVNAQGGSETFGTLLQKWAVAGLLSDRTILPPQFSTGYRYNNGNEWMTSEINGVSYNLGSINLFNYAIKTPNGGMHTGPGAFNLPFANGKTPIYPASNQYYFVGRFSGEVNLHIATESPNIKLQLLVL